MIAFDPERTVREQLEADERLLWWGCPSPGMLERYTMRVFTLAVLSAAGIGVVLVLYTILDESDTDLDSALAGLRALAPFTRWIVGAALAVAASAGVFGLIRGAGSLRAPSTP